jgi:hypothetical protein
VDRDSMPASSFTPDMVEQGRQLFYSKYACQSCHIRGFQEGQGIHRAGALGSGRAPECRLGVCLFEEPAGTTAREQSILP